MSNRRHGKVARLPQLLRDTVNQLLDDGKSYKAIIQQLHEMGYPGFTQMNISHWKHGGYRDYHLEQDRRATIRETHKAMLENTNHYSPGLLSMKVASEYFYNVLTEFDPGLLSQRLAKHPEAYFQLILTFSRLLKNRMTLDDLARNDRVLQILAAEKARKTEEENIPPLSGAHPSP